VVETTNPMVSIAFFAAFFPTAFAFHEINCLN
jgi:hypothetical protein